MQINWGIWMKKKREENIMIFNIDIVFEIYSNN